MRKNTGRILVGILFLCAAAIVLGNSTGWWSVSFDGWWTLFLIVPGLAGIIDCGVSFWNSALLLVGIWLLANEQGWLTDPFSSNLIWIVLLAAVGLELLFGGRHRRMRGCSVSDDTTVFMHDAGQEEIGGDSISRTCVFSGIKAVSHSKQFRSASLTSVFGGIQLDLTNAEPVNGAVIDVAAIFGGITIYVPRNCRVEVRGTPLFGGCSDKTLRSSDPSLPLVTVRYTAIFGGVELK